MKCRMCKKEFDKIVIFKKSQYFGLICPFCMIEMCEYFEKESEHLIEEAKQAIKEFNLDNEMDAEKILQKIKKRKNNE